MRPYVISHTSSLPTTQTRYHAPEALVHEEGGDFPEDVVRVVLDRLGVRRQHGEADLWLVLLRFACIMDNEWVVDLVGPSYLPIQHPFVHRSD